MDTIPSTKTSEEIDFIKKLIPVNTHSHILDLCCGTGRHLKGLSELSYTLLGIDSNKTAIDKANGLELPNVILRQEDIFNFSLQEESIDAVICMWQSFGYGTDSQNKELIENLRRSLKTDGFVLLDIYNKEFFERFLGERKFESSGVVVTETKTMLNNRLTVKLSYENSKDSDTFDWITFSPQEIKDYMKMLGFECMGAYSNFSTSQIPSIDNPRAQYLFQKT